MDTHGWRHNRWIKHLLMLKPLIYIHGTVCESVSRRTYSDRQLITSTCNFMSPVYLYTMYLDCRKSTRAWGEHATPKIKASPGVKPVTFYNTETRLTTPPPCHMACVHIKTIRKFKERKKKKKAWICESLEKGIDSNDKTHMLQHGHRNYKHL